MLQFVPMDVASPLTDHCSSNRSVKSRAIVFVFSACRADSLPGRGRAGGPYPVSPAMAPWPYGIWPMGRPYVRILHARDSSLRARGMACAT